MTANARPMRRHGGRWKHDCSSPRISCQETWHRDQPWDCSGSPEFIPISETFGYRVIFPQKLFLENLTGKTPTSLWLSNPFHFQSFYRQSSLDIKISSGHRFPVRDVILGPLLVTLTTEHIFTHYLPALARLLPKLNGGVEVVETPKFPILKFTAGLAVNPKPPKLNPLAVEFAVSSPPNPDEREAEKEQGNISSEWKAGPGKKSRSIFPSP